MQLIKIYNILFILVFFIFLGPFRTIFAVKITDAEQAHYHLYQGNAEEKKTAMTWLLQRGYYLEICDFLRAYEQPADWQGQLPLHHVLSLIDTSLTTVQNTLVLQPENDDFGSQRTSQLNLIQHLVSLLPHVQNVAREGCVVLLARLRFYEGGALYQRMVQTCNSAELLVLLSRHLLDMGYFDLAQSAYDRIFQFELSKELLCYHLGRVLDTASKIPSRLLIPLVEKILTYPAFIVSPGDAGVSAIETLKVKAVQSCTERENKDAQLVQFFVRQSGPEVVTSPDSVKKLFLRALTKLRDETLVNVNAGRVQERTRFLQRYRNLFLTGRLKETQIPHLLQMVGLFGETHEDFLLLQFYLNQLKIGLRNDNPQTKAWFEERRRFVEEILLGFSRREDVIYYFSNELDIAIELLDKKRFFQMLAALEKCVMTSQDFTHLLEAEEVLVREFLLEILAKDALDEQQQEALVRFLSRFANDSAEAILGIDDYDRLPPSRKDLLLRILSCAQATEEITLFFQTQLASTNSTDLLFMPLYREAYWKYLWMNGLVFIHPLKSSLSAYTLLSSADLRVFEKWKESGAYSAMDGIELVDVESMAVSVVRGSGHSDARLVEIPVLDGFGVFDLRIENNRKFYAQWLKLNDSDYSHFEEGEILDQIASGCCRVQSDFLDAYGVGMILSHNPNGSLRMQVRSTVIKLRDLKLKGSENVKQFLGNFIIELQRVIQSESSEPPYLRDLLRDVPLESRAQVVKDILALVATQPSVSSSDLESIQRIQTNLAQADTSGGEGSVSEKFIRMNITSRRDRDVETLRPRLGRFSWSCFRPKIAR
ncbi:MAG: hypothetical protein HYS98_01375 [Deltaproteobacteria bacterium]|nr:hypothetical protein [Deltaproteobacteria bacterium]